jgi:Right handed beta helix region/Pectate lyase superfamily protein
MGGFSKAARALSVPAALIAPWAAVIGDCANWNASASPEALNACVAHADSIDVTEFGAKGDSVSDNVRAFKQAIAYASKCAVSTITVPAGTYEFVPQGPEAGIYLGSNLSLLGAGAARTILSVSDSKPNSNFASLFWARNQDNISVSGITFVGNNVPIYDGNGRVLNSYGSALTIAIDSGDNTPELGTPRDLAHLIVKDCSFKNFNAAAWISVINYSTTFKIDDVRLIDNEFVSYEKNAVNPSSIGYVSNAISIMGSMTSAEGLVTKIVISGNSINARYIKGGIAIWSGVLGATIEGNTIVDAGTAAYIPNNRGAYAINVYNNAYYHDAAHADGAPMGGSRPDDVHVKGNKILHPRSCGIYAASAGRVWIEDNVISGQSDPEYESLPKGAIAVSQSSDAVVTGNKISSSFIGLALYPGNHGVIRSSGNSVDNVLPRGFAIYPAR